MLHNVANAISLPLIGGGFVVLARNLGGVIWSPGTEGIVHSLLMGLLGVGLWRYRQRNWAQKANDQR